MNNELFEICRMFVELTFGTAATEEESMTPILEQWLPQMDTNWKAILDYQG